MLKPSYSAGDVRPLHIRSWAARNSNPSSLWRHSLESGDTMLIDAVLVDAVPVRRTCLRFECRRSCRVDLVQLNVADGARY
jgi:hypothetical protein